MERQCWSHEGVILVRLWIMSQKAMECLLKCFPVLYNEIQEKLKRAGGKISNLFITAVRDRVQPLNLGYDVT